MTGVRSTSNTGDTGRALAAQLGDVVTLLVLLGLGVLGFGPVFGGTDYVIAGFGGLLLGLGLALLGTRLRWGTIVVATATALTYFVFGGVLALRPTTIAGVVPTLDTLRELALGVVFSWKQLLTVEAPVTGFDALLIVPFLSTLLTAVLAGSFALRLRRPAVALLPTAALFTVSIGFGTHETVLPVVRGILLAVVAIAWTAWRLADTRTGRTGRTEATAAGTASGAAGTAASAADTVDPASARRLRTRRLVTGSALLVSALVLGAGIGSVTAPATARQVLRDTVVPPLDLRAYASPLVGFRTYVRDYKDVTLFTVSGLPAGARLRLATLDRFDGVVYNVSGDGSTGSGTFARVGTRITDGRAGTPARLQITIDELAGVWVPDAGYLTALTVGPGFGSAEGTRSTALAASLHYNRTTGVAVSTLGLKPGDSYTADVIVPPSYTDEQLATRQVATLSMPTSVLVPEIVATSADAAITAATTPIEQVRAIETTLHSGGFFSHGLEGETVSRAGHGAERTSVLLGGDQMIGDDEQYAVAMALQVSQLGIPARVVMGFYPAEADADTLAATAGSATADLAVTGADLHAWVEVAFDGVGWVSFDPTPPTDQIPQAEQPKPKSEPQAQVLQPPLPPLAPVELPPDVLADDAPSDENNDVWSMIWLVTGITGGLIALLLVLLGPGLLVAALRKRRRRLRAHAPRPADRLSGGWSEVVDTATDLGVTVAPGATRREGCRTLAERYPEAGLTLLADRVDSGVFGPIDPTEQQLDAFWTEVDGIVAALNRSARGWARLRARHSVRSFLAGWSARAATLAQPLAHPLAQPANRLRGPRLPRLTTLAKKWRRTT
ncbi:transglutaminase domain-containing protein [Cryobacterium frigoriphilum]|uniref:Transglutaminase domain-containing protein n=1 Tax=Cryobacterium frigoriphilum TaxID=1259150 RepID=A0A4R8ZUN5_9MICO|nr:transglutaminase-like domain-containing protein [Cryobacterium frigoriphilum]TFD46341.1 transglutaminase domain-containing protein [Cryobacterium frigoriphilum]